MLGSFLEPPIYGNLRASLVLTLPARADPHKGLGGSQTIVAGCDHLSWIAVKELKLTYHNMDIKQLTWFLDYGNVYISSLTATQSVNDQLYILHPKGTCCVHASWCMYEMYSYLPKEYTCTNVVHSTPGPQRHNVATPSSAKQLSCGSWTKPVFPHGEIHQGTCKTI